MRYCWIHATQPAGLFAGLRLVELRDERRDVQQRRGEDDGHDAGHVDLDRDVGVRAAVGAAPDHALGVLHRDAALRLLDEHHERDDDDADREDEEEDLEARDCQIAHIERGEGRRDRGEDQERHAVADAALGDELGEPHDEAGAGGHRDDHEQLRPPHVVGQQLLALGDARGAEELAAARNRHEGRRLQQRERDREVARVLREPGLARLALLVEGLEVRDDHAQQLHDDRRGDVRHDAEREDRQLQQRAAREQVDQRQQTLGAGGLPEALLHVGEVDERRRNVRAEAVQGDDRQRECDLPPKVGGTEDPRDGAEQEDASRGDAGAHAAHRHPG